MMFSKSLTDRGNDVPKKLMGSGDRHGDLYERQPFFESDSKNVKEVLM